MRVATLLCLLGLLAACGAAGDPQHPDAKRPFSSQLSIGTSYNI